MTTSCDNVVVVVVVVVVEVGVVVVVFVVVPTHPMQLLQVYALIFVLLGYYVHFVSNLILVVVE